MMHQRHIVGLHCFLKLLHFIELSLYSCFHLQAGIVQLQIGTQGLCLAIFSFFRLENIGKLPPTRKPLLFSPTDVLRR